MKVTTLFTISRKGIWSTNYIKSYRRKIILCSKMIVSSVNYHSHAGCMYWLNFIANDPKNFCVLLSTHWNLNVHNSFFVCVCVCVGGFGGGGFCGRRGSAGLAGKVNVK